MRKIFITSDVHSFYTTLIKTLTGKGFEQDNPEHYLLLCGDLWDRGDESKELLDFVKSLGDRFLYVRGNHEDLIFDCASEVVTGGIVSSHHFSNRTAHTIAQLTDYNLMEVLNSRKSESTAQAIADKLNPILTWVNEHSHNYIEIGDNIFVHGWIPTDGDDLICYRSKGPFHFKEDWDMKKPERVTSIEYYKYQDMWQSARWLNGMECWKQGVKVPGKTIWCGHWHCSYGWSHIDQRRKEFPDKCRKNWEKSFETWKKEGIVALDACTSYSGIINCEVLEIKDDVEIKCF